MHADRPFWLVFNDSFDFGWHAYNWENNETYQHIIVNGLANGFYVDTTGYYEIVLEYKPQRLFVVGALISAMTMAAVLLGGFYFKALKQ